MVATIRQFVTVEAGGVVRVQSPELHEGAVAEVLITATTPSESGRAVDPSWANFIGAGAHTGRTVAEIDANI